VDLPHPIVLQQPAV